MPNALTSVPNASVPEPGRLAAFVLPLADAFMLIMLSRPAAGSLRRVWVTPATLGLTGAVAVVGLAVTALLGARWAGGAAPIMLVALVACALVTAGAAAVALVGVDQRRARGARH